jgi:hypothetical protein
LGEQAPERDIRLLVCLILRPDIAATFVPEDTRSDWWRVLGMSPTEPTASISLEAWQQTMNRLLAHRGIIVDLDATELTWSMGDWLKDKTVPKALAQRAAYLVGLLAAIDGTGAAEEVMRCVSA